MNKPSLGRVAASLLLAMALQPAAADEIPLRDFARHATMFSPRLSPDGKLLAVTTKTEDGLNALSVLQLSDMQTISLLKMPRYELPIDVIWVSDTRIAYAKARESGSLDQPRATGEVFATDYDGGKQKYLFGYMPGMKRRNGVRDFAAGYIAGVPEELNGHVYVRARPFGSDRNSRIYDVNTENEARKTVAEIGEPGMSFTLDHEGKARYAYGQNDELEYEIYQMQGKDWVKLDQEGFGEFVPRAFLPDNQRVIGFYAEDDGPEALVVQGPDGSGRTTLSSDPVFSPSELMWDISSRIPFGTIHVEGAPRYTYFSQGSPGATIHQAMAAKFPGQTVDILNASRDHQRVLLSVASDRNPGSYFLLDLGAKSLVKLFDAQPWIKPDNMAPRRPIQFTTSDDQEIHGYVTLPPGRAEQKLPAILLPHGGPHGIADSWYYDDLAQMLASRGYLVVQVNFRSSGGRGDKFMESGYRKWGTRVQQDLIEGMQSVIDSGLADKDRICVFGASFGGYSAMMTPIRAPGMFKCAVGYAGIYDLSMMYDKGDIKGHDTGLNYLDLAIGRDEGELAANSPAKMAGQVKVPVFLVHGEDDERAPFAHAKAMRAALQAAGNDPEWMAAKGEAHGFYDEGNNVELYGKLLAFFGKHIGPGAPLQ
ncbi:MAG: prolyl oligopeptidase family serine peptidase [Lysobacteraceae bacterium]